MARCPVLLLLSRWTVSAVPSLPSLQSTVYQIGNALTPGPRVVHLVPVMLLLFASEFPVLLVALHGITCIYSLSVYIHPTWEALSEEKEPFILEFGGIMVHRLKWRVLGGKRSIDRQNTQFWTNLQNSKTIMENRPRRF